MKKEGHGIRQSSFKTLLGEGYSNKEDNKKMPSKVNPKIQFQ